MTMAPSSLLSLLTTLATAFFHHRYVVLASASSSIQCRSGWTQNHQTIPPSQIDDGYCDCPLDGADEPNTGACSGSTDGMWAGVPPAHESADSDAAKPSSSFGCPEQPSLRLPSSRVDDGVCDCCDGADESSSAGSTASCPDVCDVVLAEERMVRAKLRDDYALGAKRRSDSIADYRKWHAEKSNELLRLKAEDLSAATAESGDVERSFREAKVSLATEWLRMTTEEFFVEPLMDVVGDASVMSLEDLGSFVVSLCRLSAEASPKNVANDRCVALDRASLDLGVLWNYSSDADDGSLPGFDRLDAGEEDALVEYAEKIMLRLEGKDAAKEDRSVKLKGGKRAERSSPPPDALHSSDDSGDSDDGPYGDDWEDSDHHYNDDDFDMDEDYDMDDKESDRSHEEVKPQAIVVKSETKKEEGPQLHPLVKSLLDKDPLGRGLFVERSKLLLQFSPESAEDETPEREEADESSDEGSAAEGNDADETSDDNPVDPMALTMVKSSISKRLAGISRGEASAGSAARFVASLAESGDFPLGDLRKLAVAAVYHSRLATGDVAELVYATSGGLRPAEAPAAAGGDDEPSCAPPGGIACPPSTVLLQGGTKAYPPSFIVEAAWENCDRRESLIGACAARGDEAEFPASMPGWYDDYRVPQSREGGDALGGHFSGADSRHEKLPANLSTLRKLRRDVDDEKESWTRRVAKLEAETGGDAGRKFGVDGELHSLRDTCHKVVSGKYEFEACVHGKATQRDVGEKSGGTNLGSWERADVDEDGRRTLRWGGGAKCWNGPVRSAEVAVTCGAETRLLTADEPETCRYVLTMESPIGCDEQFKAKNSL